MGFLFSPTGCHVTIFHVFVCFLIYCLLYEMDEYNKFFFVLLKLHKNQCTKEFLNLGLIFFIFCITILKEKKSVLSH